MRRVTGTSGDGDIERITIRLSPEVKSKLRLTLDILEDYDSFQEFVEEKSIEYIKERKGDLPF